MARDPATGQLGVAVQTGFFGTGTVAPWAEAGVGAVATQGWAEVSFGPRALAMLRDGHSASESLHSLLVDDPRREQRQLAIVDANGNVAAFTGEHCVRAAGHVTDEAVSAQANMVEGDTTWSAMVAAYTRASGELDSRLVAALGAAEEEGGDLRGRQSACMIIVPGDRGAPPWGRVIDLRVDDHDDPIAELARLSRRRRAFGMCIHANELMMQGDIEGARTEHSRVDALEPGEPQFWFWRALTLAQAGEPEQARQLMRQASAAGGRWEELLERLVAADLLPQTDLLLETFLADPLRDQASG